MKRSNRLVILVGVLLAVLAFVGIVILLNQGGDTGDRNQSNVTVIVAIGDIAIGDPVTPDLAETREVAPEAVEQTAIGDPSLLTGTPALVPIAAGAQITREKAGLTGDAPGPEAQLEAGEKAIAFQVDRVTGLDFLLTAGDHIDIVIAQDVTPIQQTLDSVAEQRDNPNSPARYEAVAGLTQRPDGQDDHPGPPCPVRQPDPRTVGSDRDTQRERIGRRG